MFSIGIGLRSLKISCKSRYPGYAWRWVTQAGRDGWSIKITEVSEVESGNKSIKGKRQMVYQSLLINYGYVR